MRSQIFFKNTAFLIFLVHFLIAVLALTGCGPQQFKTPLSQPFDNDGWGPGALAWNGRNLMLGEGRQIVEVSSVETGPFFSVDFPYNSDGAFMLAKGPVSLAKSATIVGLAWEAACCDRGSLWIADALNRQVIQADADFKIIKTLPFWGDSLSGLSFDGRDLWVADPARSKIYTISLSDGAVLTEYNSPLKNPLSLAWDCENIWILGMDSCKLTPKECYESRLLKLHVKSGTVTEEISLPRQMVKPTTIVWVDGVMWVGDRALNRVFKVPVIHSSSITDTTNYRSPITVKIPPRKESGTITLQTQPKSSVKDTQLLKDAQDATDRAKRAAEEAREAADKARAAADESRDAADKSKKAFELQQIK